MHAQRRSDSLVQLQMCRTKCAWLPLFDVMHLQPECSGQVVRVLNPRGTYVLFGFEIWCARSCNRAAFIKRWEGKA